MRKMSKRSFRSMLLKNKISLKSIENFRIYDFFRAKIFKKQYFSLIFASLKPMIKNIHEENFYSIVSFFFDRGIIIPFDGNIEKYLHQVCLEIINKYYPTDKDSDSVINRKIDYLYRLFSDIDSNKDEFITAIVVDRILPVITKTVIS